MDINVKDLITEIHHRPAIWNSKHFQHKNKTVLKLMWEEIQMVRFPQYEVAKIKKKWKTIRERYRKELKKKETQKVEKPDAADYELSEWKYFNILAFLKDEYVNATDKNIDDSPDDCSTSSPLPLPREESNQQFDEMYSQIIPSEANKSSQKRSIPNDIRAEYLEIERKKLKILEQEVARQNNTDPVRSDDYYYLMSILPEMQKFTPIQKMRVRNKINQVLMDEMMLNTGPEAAPQAYNSYDAYDPQNSFIKEETF